MYYAEAGKNLADHDMAAAYFAAARRHSREADAMLDDAEAEPQREKDEP